ncbi:MAG: hypothetical protein JRF23_02230 [Deltaproteobacteria bacterium]|nr:hypothetical protein [Deltaproteobacteria bacterium]
MAGLPVAVQPKWLKVTVFQKSRGGITITAEPETGQPTKTPDIFYRQDCLWRPIHNMRTVWSTMVKMRRYISQKSMFIGTRRREVGQPRNERKGAPE